MFGSLMGDFDDDPFYGGHMRQMNSMMNSFFQQPFGGLLGGAGTELMPFGARPGAVGPMVPFGFPNMNRLLFQDLSQAANSPNCHAYSSSSVMTMTSGPDGRPQVYQASSSMRQGPNGVRETQKAVSDSRSGVKKLAIGHHIGERAHIMEREHNMHSGEQEERQEYINLEEEEADDFNSEWMQKARAMRPTEAVGYRSVGGSHHRRHPPQLALPPSTNRSRNLHPPSPSTETYNSSSGRIREGRHSRRTHPALPSTSRKTRKY